MQITLTNSEMEVLQSIVEKDIHEMLMEIARTDARKYREGLKEREELLLSIQKKLAATDIASPVS